jgi:hypothetical protein
MNAEAVIKGTLVFALTFGAFVLAKQGKATEPTGSQVTQAVTPVESAAPTDAKIAEQSTAATSALSTESTAYPSGTTAESQASARPSDIPSVEDALTKWRSAIVSNDPRLEAACYAPVLTSYLNQSNIGNFVVQADRQSFLDEGNRIVSVNFEQVRMDDVTPSSATVHLVKDVTWQNVDGVQIQRKAASTVTLQSFVDGWKIVSEQDSR